MKILPIINCYALRFALPMVALLLFAGCEGDPKPKDPAINNLWVSFSASEVTFTDQGGTKGVTVILAEGISEQSLTVSVAANGQGWVNASIAGRMLTVSTKSPAVEYDRATVIVIKSGDLKRELPIVQSARAIESPDDRLLSVGAMSASSVMPNFEIEKSCDGNDHTYYISSTDTEFPVTLDYALESSCRVDYIMYYPRADDGDDRAGAFGLFEVWIKSEAAAADTREGAEEGDGYIKIGEYDHGQNPQRPCKINLPKGSNGVDAIRFVVQSGLGDRVSTSHIRFYEALEQRVDVEEIFTDATYSQLKPEVTGAQIGCMTDPFFQKIASGLLTGSYSTKFRVKEFRPYQNPSIRSTLNKHSGYSLRDNLTGIYVDAGEDVLIYVGPTKGQDVKMVVQDLKSRGYNGANTYPLVEGKNEIKVNGGGLVYISNFTNDDIPLLPQTEQERALVAAKSVKIHFVNAFENGYFDSENPAHDQDFWVELLRNSRSTDIDAVGKYCHITWNVEDYLVKSPGGATKILATIANYDSLVRWEWDFMGHLKYGTAPRNRMYFHADYTHGSAYAASNHTGYRRSVSNWGYYSQLFCEPTAFGSRYWGPSHEVGHCNQTTGLKWAGMTEVTNNIHSQYVGYKLHGTGPKTDYYAKANKETAQNGVSHALSTRDGQIIVFWQLFVYMSEVRGNKDFYKDLYQSYRVRPNIDVSGDITTGAQQLEFVRRVCELANLDLREFFAKRGFFVPVDTKINDYGDKTFRITQAQVDALFAELDAKSYPLPRRSDGTTITDLHLITDANRDSYK